MNASDDRSDGMSVVIGHDFGLKDSSSVSLNKMEGSGNDKNDRIVIHPVPIEEKTEEHLKTEEMENYSSIDDMPMHIPEYKIEVQPDPQETSYPKTPEHKPTSRRFNSTIK